MLIFHELTQYRVGLGLNALFESRVRTNHLDEISPHIRILVAKCPAGAVK